MKFFLTDFYHVPEKLSIADLRPKISDVTATRTNKRRPLQVRANKRRRLIWIEKNN